MWRMWGDCESLKSAISQLKESMRLIQFSFVLAKILPRFNSRAGPSFSRPYLTAFRVSSSKGAEECCVI